MLTLRLGVQNQKHSQEDHRYPRLKPGFLFSLQLLTELTWILPSLIFDVLFDCCFVDADTAYEVARRPHNIFLPIHLCQPFKLLPHDWRWPAFQIPHYIAHTISRRDDQDVKMVTVTADHLDLNAGHTSQQQMQDLLEIIPDSRLQDPPAVFAYPHHVIVKTICTVSSQSYFHTSRTYRLRAHSSTGKPVVFCLRPHKIHWLCQIQNLLIVILCIFSELSSIIPEKCIIIETRLLLFDKIL